MTSPSFPHPGVLPLLHARAWQIAERLAAEPERFGTQARRLQNGSLLIDCGVVAPGGLAAGVEFARACLGGLAEVEVIPWSLGEVPLAACRVVTDHPLAACIGSQYAGWKIQAGKFFGMGSGPARAAAGVEPLFERYPLRERAERTVLLLECSELPDEEVAAKVAGSCGVPPSSLILAAAATGSLAGSLQIAARSVETALHKMMELGFDLRQVRSGVGLCPISPVIPHPLKAIGRTNDAVLYGAEVHLAVDAEDEMLSGFIERIPSASSKDHGRLFYDLFKEHGDFYKIDPMLFSPARVSVSNLRTGRLFAAGRSCPDLLRRSFGLL
jgi:methenyltetrahydromethanopterin cyclohydrolase